MDEELPKEACDNFRASYASKKALKDTDVNRIFAAVCVHGFIYRMKGKSFLSICYISYYCLDVARGESLDYAAEIAKKFNTEFPKARLTIAYDIACKLKNIFAVIIILSLHLPTFLEAKGQLF